MGLSFSGYQGCLNSQALLETSNFCFKRRHSLTSTDSRDIPGNIGSGKSKAAAVKQPEPVATGAVAASARKDSLEPQPTIPAPKTPPAAKSKPLSNGDFSLSPDPTAPPDSSGVQSREAELWDPSTLCKAPVVDCSSVTHIGANSAMTGNPLKSENQDVVSAIISWDGEEHYGMFTVFDGHGQDGLGCAQFCEQAMERRLKLSLGSSTPPQDALKSAFIAVQRELAASERESKFSGATASVALVAGNVLYFAHAGDSRGILVSTGTHNLATVENLGKDHRPDDAKEKGRIEMQGGRVVCKMDAAGNTIGPPRVYHAVDPFPGLMLSRSLGDTYAHSLGVSALPEITTVALQPTHKLLVVGSDGVWDVMSSQEVGDLVLGCGTAAEACDLILQESLRRWQAKGSADNVGVVVAQLDLPI